MKKPTQTTCADCSFYAQNHWTATLECGGLLLQPGCRACLGGRRPRRFRSGDPKVALPAWCPRRKNPCDVRIYELKSSHDWFLHHALSTQLGHAITPAAHRYGLAATLQTELTALAFWKRAMPPSVASPLPVPIALYGVVEIDDGIHPVFFYQTAEGLELLSDFDAETAKHNTVSTEKGTTL